MQTEILYGIHPVTEALRTGRRRIQTIWIIRGKQNPRLQGLRRLAAEAGVSLTEADPAQLKARAGTLHHQGVAAQVSRYETVDLDRLLGSSSDPEIPPFLLLVDQVQDPQNLGGLIRTALCVGVNGIILPKDRTAPLSPAVSRASAGALEHIRLHQAVNLVNTMKRLKKTGCWLAGLDQDARSAIYDSDLSGALGLVVGGEEKGLRPLVKRTCDFLMAIPQTGVIDSLNVSVAGGVALYEAFRQRQASKAHPEVHTF